MVSPTSVGALKTLLPIQELQNAAHSFTVRTYKGRDPRLRSTITVVCAQDAKAPFLILAKHRAALRNYRVTQVEVALDEGHVTPAGAAERLLALIKGTTKLRHRRRRILSVHAPDQEPPAGCVSEPTIYFEARRSSVRLKGYVRHRKLPGRAFGERHARLEWTLTGKRAIARHLGGNKIENLLAADLNAFVERNLRLEQVDHVTLGYVLRGIPATRRRKTQPGEPGDKKMTRASSSYARCLLLALSGHVTGHF